MAEAHDKDDCRGFKSSVTCREEMGSAGSVCVCVCVCVCACV